MAKPRSLLDRLLDAHDIAQIVPRLHADVLHRVILRCGLEDSADVIALATPAQLGNILDADIWRVSARGTDEAFDVERFGVWLQVLMEAGPSAAAEKLMGLDLDLVTVGVGRHAAVFDAAAVAPFTTLDGDVTGGRASRAATAEIGGYVLEARRTTAWESIVDLLAHLDAEHPVYFHRLMRACVRVSSGRREPDGFHALLEDDEQAMFELACDRESRRERQGYLSPAQARAFLQSARQTTLDADTPPQSPLARAYFRTLDTTPADHGSQSPAGRLPAACGDAEPMLPPAAAAGVVEILRDEGVLAPPPKALLGPVEATPARLTLVRDHIETRPVSVEELAYLANAIAAGCSINDRAFTMDEASQAAAAACNLGLENWPAAWREPDLLSAFHVGWTILHRSACLYTAERLVNVLAGLRSRDRDVHLRLNGLRQELTRHLREQAPWRARQALDVLVMLDAPAWMAVLGLVDECPVVHAALRASTEPCRSIDPADFEFISENGQMAAIRSFMALLPALLAGTSR